jgi:ABC-type transport system involved in cytochrome c biogenesis ATPase subunit
MKQSDFFLHFSVKKLFGRFDHDILVPIESGQIRYVSAPNGTGKSTVLRIITYVSECSWAKLSEITFDEVGFDFKSGARLRITRLHVESKLLLEVNLISSGGTALSWTPNIEPPILDENALPPYVFKHRRPASPDRAFTDMRTGKFYSADSAARQFMTPTETEPPSEIADLLTCLRVFYLDTHRLRNNDNDELSVEVVSQVIEGAIERARIEYGNHSRKQETTFPSRLIERIVKNPKKKILVLDDLSTRYMALTEEDGRFKGLSLTDGGLEAINTTKWQQARASQAESVLGLWLDDIEERFRKLTPLADRLEMFRNTLNKMLTAKNVSFRSTTLQSADDHSRNTKGALLISDLNNKEIALSALSSGEQHLIVMLGRVMFDPAVPSGTLVLLDEPEISLHPDWQTALSTTLRKVAGVSDIRLILATHSPLMINGDWNDEIFWECE